MNSSVLTETVVPSWIAAVLGIATVALLASVLLLMRAKKAAGKTDPIARDAKVLRRLFIAALVPSLIVIVSVMAISFVGLSSFARDEMGFQGLAALIVPLTLDGISITFGFWSFVAVKRGRDPQHSNRIVYAGALISAWINYQHGSTVWTGAAGIYLGFLSLASAWMFHELLSQFMDGQATRPKARRNGVPIFGERWLWAPISTLTARRAWIVFPPSTDVEATVANALTHHEHVKAMKGTRKLRRKVAVDALARQLTNSPVPATAVPAAPAYMPAAAPTTHLSAVDMAPARPAHAPVQAPVPTPDVVAQRIATRHTEDARDIRPVTGPAAPPVRPRTSAPRSTATPLAPSSTDSSVTATEAVQLVLPMLSPARIQRARELAQQHQVEHGTPITAGTLAVRLRIPTEQATQLLAELTTAPASAPSVNGHEFKAA